MTILAVSICSHGGKALLSRQFRELSRARVTELMANFPSLLSSSTRQNTTIEDELVRYVYHPLEEYFVVMLTTKQSNILQNIDTLRLFVSVTSQMLKTVEEREIHANAFELLSAFDEIVNLGYCERLSLSQVQGFLEMDSHEERIQEIIEKNKEMEATEERRRRAKEIHRKELARRNMDQQQVASRSNASFSGNSPQTQELFDKKPVPLGSSYGYSEAQSSQKSPAVPRAVGGKGLQLGKKPSKQETFQERQPLLTSLQPNQKQISEDFQLLQYQQIPATPATRLSREEHSTRLTPTLEVPSDTSGILIVITEKITAELTREGTVASAEVRGDLQLRIGSADFARARLILKMEGPNHVQYKTHPNVDRALFLSSGIIGLKDPSRPFPSNGQSLGVLRWKVQEFPNSTIVPLIVSAWVSFDKGVANVTLEYEITSAYIKAHPSQIAFANVEITVPVAPEAAKHALLKNDLLGNVSCNYSDHGIIFSVAQILLENPVGAFEFSLPVEDEDSLFPMQITFESVRTSDISKTDSCFGQVRVIDVVSADTDERSLPFFLHQDIATEGYSVE